MLILHGSWVPDHVSEYQEGSFVIWAEWTDKYEDWEKGLFSRSRKHRCHPFVAAQPAILASWPFFLQHSGLADLLCLYKSLEDSRWIWLPTDQYGPLGSPLLYSKLQNTNLLDDSDLDPGSILKGETWVQHQFDDTSRDGLMSGSHGWQEATPQRYSAEAKLKPWRVPVVELTAWGAMQFLLAVRPEHPIQMIPETAKELVHNEDLFTLEQRNAFWKDFLRKQRNLCPAISYDSMGKKKGSKDLEWLGLERIEAGFYLLDDVMLADDLLYWQQLSLVVQEMIVHQEYLPSLTVSNQPDSNLLFNAGHAHAHWRPVIQRKELQQFMLETTAAMPLLSRAIDPRRGENDERVPRKAFALHAGLLVDAFVAALTDAGVRQFSPAPLSRVQANHSPDRQWINALLTEKNVQLRTINAKHWERFEELQSWAGRCLEASQYKLQMGLRLENADQPSADCPWQLTVFLQDQEDLSLMIPADLIWSKTGANLQLIGHSQQYMQEFFLAQLGSASHIYPPLSRSMLTAHPQAAPLSPEEAYDFIQKSAGLLEIAGFRIMLPSFLSNFSVKMKLKSPRSKQKSTTTSSGTMGLAILLDFDWQLSVGDQILSENDFKELVALKQPLVNLRGQWIEMNPDEIAALQELWQHQQKKGQISLMEVLRSGVPLSVNDSEFRPGQDKSSILGIPVNELTVEGWLKDNLLRLQDSNRLELLPVPSAFQGELRPYQQRGYSWLRFLADQGLGACLADDMGLGKTIQCLAFLLSRQQENLDTGPVLLLCPTSVVGNWQRETNRFAPALKCLVHHGGARLSGDQFLQAVAANQLIISSYSLLSRDYELMQAVTWQGIILDEAQNIKNPDTQQARTVKSLSVDGFRIAMTGTPIENRLQELWSIMDFLNPGYLGTQNGFNKTYALPIERGNDQITSRRLSRAVAPFVLRRQKTDPGIAPELPDKLENKIYCNLFKEQASLYEAIVQNTMSRLDKTEGMERRGLVLSTLLKLKQCCNHPALLLKDHSPLQGRSGKLSRLEEMLEEINAQGEKALIFTQYAQWAKRLQEYLQKQLGQEVLCLHGGTPRLAREQMVQRFQEEKSPTTFILSVKAGGVGINLTRANHVFHYDRWWNPAVEEQASDRAYRIGQTRNVEVHKFICAGTLEEKIDTLIEHKRTLGADIVGSGEAQLTELSTDELQQLLSLNWNEVGED